MASFVWYPRRFATGFIARRCAFWFRHWRPNRRPSMPEGRRRVARRGVDILTRIVHISDLHFGRTDPQVVEGLVADINRQPPDLVVVSGDLTLSARRVEFQEARAFLDRLAAPFLAVPGNHDISPYRMVERFVFPYRRWRTFISPTIEPEWRDTQVAIVGINTARRMALHWNWSHGRVNRAQIERVGRRFARLPGHLFRIVVAHHPFMPPAEAAGPPRRPRQKSRRCLLAIWRRSRPVGPSPPRLSAGARRRSGGAARWARSYRRRPARRPRGHRHIDASARRAQQLQHHLRRRPRLPDECPPVGRRPLG